MVSSWLETNMFSDDPNPKDKAAVVVAALGSPEKTLSHGRHISIDQAEPWDSRLRLSKMTRRSKMLS
jgi:hypothetical protein